MIYATKRSGHHAFVHWFCMQHGNITHYNNPNINKFLSNKLSGYVKLAQKNFENVYGSGRDRIYNWEEKSYIKYNEKLNNKINGEISEIFFIRDYYNTLASSIKNKGVRIPESLSMEHLRETWIEYARMILGGKDYVLYNQFVTNKSYRNMLSDYYNLNKTDKGINHIPPHAGGSSFDKLKFQNNAHCMDVNNRYKKYIYNDEFRNLIDDEIHNLNHQIFGWDIKKDL
jgi:hypothetical protein